MTALIFTFVFVSALLRLSQVAAQFSELRQNVVQLDRLSLTLHDDGKHGQTGQNRPCSDGDMRS